LSAERVWDFTEQNSLKIYERGRLNSSSRKYQYEVYMTPHIFLAFKLAHPDIEIYKIDVEPVEDLMTSHFLEVSREEADKVMGDVLRLLGIGCVVSKVGYHTKGCLVKVVVVDGSEEESLLKLTYGHLINEN